MIGSTVRLLRPAALLAALAGATVVAATPAAAAPAGPTTVITGVVTAVDGAPLRNVTVKVLYPSVTVNGGTTTTAVDGTYRVRTPQAAGAQVQFLAASATGGTSATGYADACYQGPAFCQEGGRSIDLTGVASRRVDATLGRASVLRGRVVDSLGRGVGGLLVNGAIASIQSPRNGRPDASAVTDVNGNWSFGRVDPLGWNVGYDARDSGPLTPAPYGYADSFGGLATVAAGKTVVLAQTLEGLGAVAGTVTDQAGAPIGGAYVVLSRGGVLLTADTDADGKFRLVGAPVGGSDLCVTAANYDEACGPGGNDSLVTVKEFAVTRVTIPLRRTS